MPTVTDDLRPRATANTLAAVIGTRISQRRAQRGMTAAELARRADLSKATLSALESGSANPTISTLDALAVALRIPLSDLLAEVPEPGPLHIRATQTEQGQVQRELLRRMSGGHALEIWRMRLPPHHHSEGLPHAPGTIEHLYVAAGRVLAGPKDQVTELHAGDMLAFPGDGPHEYTTETEPADLTVTFAAPAS